MFDGMRYVPVLLRGEVALLKEVPEDDVASSTCTERYGKRGPGASTRPPASAENMEATMRASR